MKFQLILSWFAYGSLRVVFLRQHWIILKISSNDTIQQRLNSDFDVKCPTIQFYGNSHNSQSDRWIDLTFYVEYPDMLSYRRLKFQVNWRSGRHRNTGKQRLYEFCYLLPFDLWTSYLVRILFLKGCGRLFWKSPNIFNGLQHSFHVWQEFINVSESFFYKDSLFILLTTRKEDFRINSTFIIDSPSLYGVSKGQ
jgi:hypothetical protein